MTVAGILGAIFSDGGQHDGGGGSWGFFVLVLLAGSLSAAAQSTSSTSYPSGFNAGSITVNNNTLRGHVRDNIRKSSEVVFMNGDGIKKTYNASQVSAVTIDPDKYVVIADVFYKVIAEGPKVNLLRRASSAAAIQYNGADPIASASSPGAYNDYFILPAGGQLQLVLKRDFRKLAETVFADCQTLAADIRSSRITFANIEQAVRTYNQCTQ